MSGTNGSSRSGADIRLRNLSGSSPMGSRRSIVCPVVRILTHIGEPSEALLISRCRGSPDWETFDQTVEFEPIHPEPEYEFDQSVSW